MYHNIESCKLFQYLNDQHTIFAYLHLAGNKKDALELASTGITGIALETVTADDGSMPLLSPMSAIAGQLSIVVGSYHLLKPNRGMGTLIGAMSDVERRVVTVIGAGVAGTMAIEKAIDNKAHVKITRYQAFCHAKEQFCLLKIEK